MGLVFAALAVVAFTLLGKEEGATQTTRQRAAAAPVTRTYFIGADKVEWDYAPTGSNQITGQSFGEDENVFAQQGPDRIGKVYTKSL
ncbi:hypothetical protein GBA63_20290 [Rubrobacter tropicus]|uniref:Uncharacterized protein n=1 Tax=Rubrobacter tropicus TaxID=2653851 RepID=A0A6G8QER2_9ACTN|nr:hypothetical protein [Rubrobacter tropicus]QIN84727.1 hypothetical protein GBA63_20290 [Rubrobacter tropicus]